ncbi:AAA domain-containing protein, partial [Neobacillus niacini]|uniref:AAA domain-containing protein n=1 Tax=Neobacillus niacini TaxID=86668 RepID=UPI00300046A1
YDNVAWSKEPILIDSNTCVIYENNLPITGVIKILDFGEYVRLLFRTGYKRVYNRSSIIIEETCLTNKTASNTFDYLKALAGYVSIKDEGDKGFLTKQYEYLKIISPRSVLSAYLERKPFKTQNKAGQTIFPFGFNKSQKLATEKALSNQVSIIEGPPGTGKTQTILNIIANAIINDQTIAVVSNNNAATSNVLEKLQRYEVDFIAAYLGNKNNKADFFSRQNGNYPDMNQCAIPKSDLSTIKADLLSTQRKLNEMLDYQNKQALLKEELSGLQTEYKYFTNYYHESNFSPIKIRSIFKLSADKTLKILVDFKQHSINGKIPLKDKLYNLLFHGIYNLRIYKYPPEQVISFLQKLFYKKKIKELCQQIEVYTEKLENYDFENEMKEYSHRSMDLFKTKLAEKYDNRVTRTVYSEDALWKGFNQFINDYPVILSTTHSLRNSTERNYLFDYVIIDEASQVDIVTGALALSCAKNAVVVGDVNQLPNVVPNDVATITERVFNSFGLEEAYNYADHSLLSSFLNLYKNIPKTLLKEHYRCHPRIIGFCNQKFYNNELIILTDEQESNKPLVLYKTAKGNHARGKVNQRQIDVIFNEIIPEEKLINDNQTIGIISPYRMQANELQNAIGNQEKMEADTVHKFQGRERDVIILTTVANEITVNDFVDNANLINVAVSRAVNKLVVVVAEGSDEWKGTNIGDLVRYIQYNNFEIIESQIYSVFDLLYNSYSEKLLTIAKKSKKVSEFKSENLMNTVIDNVLTSNEFSSLDWVLHQPLRMLIKDSSKLTDDERKYALNILTHTDFVIFNKLDKMPILVVEVDGHAYHANNPVQQKRDKMKDEILYKYGIPILRMKTTESREADRLRQKLREILNLNTNTEVSQDPIALK